MTSYAKLFFTILLITLIVSCGQNNAPQQKPQDTSRLTGLQKDTLKTVAPEAIEQKPLVIGTFSTLPPQIEGCSCTFSENEQQDKKRVYIYADNLEYQAFIRIDGKMTQFTLDGEKKESGGHTIGTYFAPDYKLVIDTEKVGQVDESSQMRGTLKLTRKDGKTVVKNIVGTCGC